MTDKFKQFWGDLPTVWQAFTVIAAIFVGAQVVSAKTTEIRQLPDRVAKAESRAAALDSTVKNWKLTADDEFDRIIANDSVVRVQVAFIACMVRARGTRTMEDRCLLRASPLIPLPFGDEEITK